MSATISHPSIIVSAVARPLRFGIESGAGEPSVQWLFRRNCSTTPRQMMAFFAALSLLPLAIASMFWWQGALLVMPFAWLEVAAVGTALLICARHATDRESIALRAGRLTVEHVFGRHVERAEFVPAWVRVEPAHGERSLIELSGQGQRISVGRFVRPELRSQLADELRWAMRRWQWTNGGASAAVARGEPAPNRFEN